MCAKCDGECTHLAHNQCRCLPEQIPTLYDIFVHIVELGSNVNDILLTIRSVGSLGERSLRVPDEEKPKCTQNIVFASILSLPTILARRKPWR